jgi:hypothetical protein
MALNVRGALPPYIVKSIRRDQNGIFAGVAERHFMVGEVNQRIDLIWLTPASAPNPWGLPCTDASGEINDAGVCIVTYQYQGLDQSWTFAEEDQVTFELDTSMNEDPIETHPAFKQLKKIYGWSQTERMFAESVPNINTGNALTTTAGKTIPNPLFGTDTWLTIGAIYRRTYAARSIPSTVLQGIGTIVKRPPDIGQFKLPADSKKRNWLKLSPKVSRTGNAVRITEEWMLSGPKGWLVPIYSTAQLGLD